MRHISYDCARCGNKNPKWVYFGVLHALSRESVYRDFRSDPELGQKGDNKESQADIVVEGCDACLLDSFAKDCDELVIKREKQVIDSKATVERITIAQEILSDAANGYAGRTAKGVMFDKVVLRPCRECGGNGDSVIYGQVVGAAGKSEHGSQEKEWSAGFDFSFCDLCRSTIPAIFMDKAVNFLEKLIEKRSEKKVDAQ